MPVYAGNPCTIHDCLIKQPMYTTKKKLERKKNSKCFWAHYTVNQKQDKNTTLRIRIKTRKEPT